MSCLFYCCTKRTYFYAFLFLYRFFGNSSDHGMIFSSKSAVSLFPVILVSMYSIYSYGFRPFIFALSIMLYAAPLALAPLMLFENRKYFLHQESKPFVYRSWKYKYDCHYNTF